MGGGVLMDFGGNKVVVVVSFLFFFSSQSGFWVVGDGLCLCMVVVAGGWLVLTFSRNSFFTCKTKHMK